jgi:hypothetical protein
MDQYWNKQHAAHYLYTTNNMTTTTSTTRMNIAVNFCLDSRRPIEPMSRLAESVIPEYSAACDARQHRQ